LTPQDRIHDLENALKGLYEIALQSMPDTYIQTDSRMIEARRVYEELNKLGNVRI